MDNEAQKYWISRFTREAIHYRIKAQKLTGFARKQAIEYAKLCYWMRNDLQSRSK